QRELIEAHLTIQVDGAVVLHLNRGVDAAQVRGQTELRLGRRVLAVDRQEAQSVAKGADIAGAVVAPGGELERVFFNVHDIAAQGDPFEVAKTLERERRVPVVLLGSERNGQRQRRAVRIGTKELLVVLVRSRSRELARDAR